jgi:hypothetical protein
MTARLCRFFLCVTISLGALCAQSRPTGTGYVTAAFSGTTLYAYAQTQLSGMQIPPGTNIIHTVTAGFSLGVRGGALKPFAQSASAGPQYSQEVEEDGDIPDNGDVVYIVVAGDIASCNYFGTIWSDTVTTSYELPPTITSLQGATGSAFTPHVDTPQSAGQTLVINGANLTAAGQSDPPQICVNGACAVGGSISATGFHLGGSWNVGDTAIAIPYWVDATATAGNYSLQLNTAGGAATATFSVTDATPVITGVSPSTLVVGVAATVTITGSHFGTNTPQVSLSLPNNGVSLLGGNTDSQIQVSVMATAPGAGTLSVTAEGYGGQGFLGSPGAGQTASAGITAVEPVIQFTYNGSIVPNGGTVFITPTPALPLFASLSPQPLAGNLNWTLSIVYNSPGSYTYTCSQAATVAASSTWNMAASPPYCGGTATLTFTYGPAHGSASLTILGQNPSVATVKSLLVTGPWYAEQLANSESPGYLQFQSTGYPVFGSPNGYGIMQIDYNNSPYDV